jgi:hypothetical protein
MPTSWPIMHGHRWNETPSKALGTRSSLRYTPQMAVDLPPNWSELLKQAIAHYWRTLEAQSSKQSSGDTDRGRRAAVTGGKQMDKFCSLVAAVAETNGMPKASIYTSAKLEIPGYFRPTKQWDMVLVDRGRLVAALEFKSQRGPSFGNNFNNRAEEALGTASDLWTAYREGAFGANQPAPWLGWIMMLEECAGSTSPVAVSEPHFQVFPEFRDASYIKRYELLLRKLVLEKHYNAAAFMTTTELGGPKGEFAEPSEELMMRALLLAFAGHVATHVAMSKTP